MTRHLARTVLAGARGDRRQELALVAAALAVALLGLMNAWSNPLLSEGDEMSHFDYAYQLWHGDLPVFEEGVVVRPGFGQVTRRQWAAHHPPLYDALLAPIVGPLTDAGHVGLAAHGARAFNVGVAILAVLAAAWAARWAFPCRRSLPAVVALVVAVSPMVGRLAGSARNDLFSMLLVTLMIGAGCQAVRLGLSRWRAVVLALLSTACLAAKIALVIPVVVIVGAALLCALVRMARERRSDRSTQRLGPILGLALGGPVLAGAASGWFYLRNLRVTGSVSGNQLDYVVANMDRHTRPYLDMLAVRHAHEELLRIWGRLTFPDLVPVFVLVVVPVLCAVLYGVVSMRRTGLEGTVIGLSLAVIVVALHLVQLYYGSQGGALTPRYMIPVATVFAIGIGYALVAGGRWVPNLVGIWCLVPLLDSAGWLRSSIEGPVWLGAVPPSLCWALWGTASILVIAGSAFVYRSPSSASQPTTKEHP